MRAPNRKFGVGLVALLVATATLLSGQPVASAGPEPYSYREVVRKVLPAVVSLECRGVVGREDGATVGFGSGFVIDARGLIATCAHVVEGAEVVEVVLADGRRFVAKDVRIDTKTDLALIRIEPAQALPVLAWADSDAMEIGDRVLAVGAPFRLTGSVTHGIISGKGRSLRLNLYEDFLQTDAAINPGNSGGPLINLEGRVVGVNSAIKSKTGGFQGIGLAIAAGMGRQILGQLQTHGVVRRGYLGLQIAELESPELAARLGLKSVQGVVVTQVFEGGPARKAGLVSGDLITALDGKPIKDGKDLQTETARLPLNQPVDVTLARDGKLQTLRVTIEEQPREFGSNRPPLRGAVPVDRFGLELSDPPVNEVRGAVVVKVTPTGPAALAGLRPGLTILRIDNQIVDSAVTAREALAKGSLERGILLQIFSQASGTTYLMLRSGG